MNGIVAALVDVAGWPAVGLLALGACVVDDEDREHYCLTPLGEQAIELPWEEIVVED